MQLGWRHVRRCLLVSRTNANKRPRNGTEERKQVPLTRRGLPIPIATRESKWPYFVEGVGGR